MTLTPAEAEQFNPKEYELLNSGDYLITEEFPNDTREELLLLSRDVINRAATEKPDVASLFEESGQSGDVYISGLSATPDTEIGIRVSKSPDEGKDGSLTIYRSAYANTSEENPAISVTFGPNGELITGTYSNASSINKTAVSESEAVAFANEMIKKVQQSLSPVESN